MRLSVQPLSRWLVLSHLVVFVLPAFALICSGALAEDLKQQTREDLDHQASWLALMIGESMRHAGKDATIEDVAPTMNGVLRDARNQTLAGFRVVDTEGVVVASSGDGLGEDIGDSPEVRAALGGKDFAVQRPRNTTNSRKEGLSSAARRAPVRIYLAHPVVVDDTLVGAVVLSRTPREELQTFYQMAPRLLWGVGAGLAATVALGLVSGRVLSRSLKGLARASHRIAGGQLSAVTELEPATRSHILEARELASAMATMSARLQERLRYITEFAGNVSHEFKTPVSSLRGTLELIRDDEEMPPEQRERFLDNATADLDRLSRLVGGLLRLARAEEGGDRAVVGLGELLATALARHPGVPLDGEGGRVEVNAAQLESVVANLVENALRHGGEGVHVAVHLFTADGHTGFEVVDDGVGISAANLPRVFDRFFTTDRAGGGTGLGLALVRAIVVGHGGHVSVTSQPGRTCFRVELPRVD